MKYNVKYYDCKADSEDAAIISFRRNVSSNVQRYKILMVKGVKENNKRGCKPSLFNSMEY